MKRVLIAGSIVASAACLFGAAQNQMTASHKLTTTRREQCRVQAARLEQLRTECNALQQQVDETRRSTKSLERDTLVDDLAEEYAKNGLANLSPAQSERLRAELGFNWNSPGGYVIVSKKSLVSISLPAIRDGKLTDAVRSALAMTPEEQAAIETELHRVNDEYKTWALAHVQREEPNGDVLAKYVLPADPQSSNSLQSLSEVIRETLGNDERDKLFFEYSWKWGDAHQLTEPGLPNRPSQTAMTIKRSGDSLMLYLDQPNSLMSCSITPSQPFPEAFLPLFPGGWKELASREGFELPKEFQKNK